MSIVGYLIVIAGAASAAVNLMRLIDRLEHPRRRRAA